MGNLYGSQSIDHIRQNAINNQPTYYHLESGFTNACCEMFEGPARLLYYGWDTSSWVVSALAFVVLGIPAAVGLAAKKIIYFTSAERIKESDYNTELNNWLGKTFSGGHDYRIVEGFINLCITNKIKAKECPAKQINVKTRSDRLFVFTADGEACVNSADPNHPEKERNLVLFASRSVWVVRRWNSAHTDALQDKKLASKSGIATVEATHSLYLKFSQNDVDLRLIPKCNCVNFCNNEFYTLEQIKVIRDNITRKNLPNPKSLSNANESNSLYA